MSYYFDRKKMVSFFKKKLRKANRKKKARDSNRNLNHLDQCCPDYLIKALIKQTPPSIFTDST